MLYLAPDTIDQEALADADDTDRTADLVFTYPVSQTSLNGTTGKPSLGNADDGKRLFNKMRDALVDMLERAKIEEPPLPRAEWASAPKSFYC
jgi:creatinine amidohydrolase